MANQEHLRILEQAIEQGIELWNQWRIICDEKQPTLSEDHQGRLVRRYEPDLSGAELSTADLCEADLGVANLAGANLSGVGLCDADLSLARLNGANLRNADIRGARLDAADISKADLSGADLMGANLQMANLSGTDLSDADLRKSILIETNLKGADISRCKVYGISAWNLQTDENTAQNDLIITQDNEPDITVDNIKVAQFIHLLLNNKEIRDVIDAITSKVVLILGRFSDVQKPVLDALREALRKRNYCPVMFDFNKPKSKTTTETITTLARMARFIVADLTEPRSIPGELVSIVQDLPSLPVQPILKDGEKPWGMYDHIKRYPWVLDIHRYNDFEDLLVSLQDKVIIPAEVKARELQERKGKK